jgi:hypothetical protein
LRLFPALWMRLIDCLSVDCQSTSSFHCRRCLATQMVTTTGGSPRQLTRGLTALRLFQAKRKFRAGLKAVHLVARVQTLLTFRTHPDMATDIANQGSVDLPWEDLLEETCRWSIMRVTLRWMWRMIPIIFRFHHQRAPWIR